MNTEIKKTPLPPYVPYSTFSSFINGLKDTGIPSHIDRSIMTNMSGSGQSAMLATIKALGLIDTNSEPTERLDMLVNGEESQLRETIEAIVIDTYGFLFDESIQIQNTTSKKVEEKFRAAGASGSTLTKCISFFLAAAKAANITVSPHVRAPKLQQSSSSSQRSKKDKDSPGETGKSSSTPPSDVAPAGMRKFEIPLRDIKDGVLYLPIDLKSEDASKALRFIEFTLSQYYDITRDGSG